MSKGIACSGALVRATAAAAIIAAGAAPALAAGQMGGASGQAQARGGGMAAGRDETGGGRGGGQGAARGGGLEDRVLRKGRRKDEAGSDRTSGAARGGAAELDEAELTALLYMIEEEKLAHDVYVALYDATGLPIFANIIDAETRHHDAMLSQADRLGIDVSGLPTAEGEFADPELQALYDRLVSEGSASETAALEVGVFIEATDLVDIAAAIEVTDDTALDQSYANLLAGSENHLAAFESQLD